MKFGLLVEEQLRKSADGRLDNIFDLWHQAVADRTERRIEIRLGNRRDNGSPIRGGILTESVITMGSNGSFLIIWYDPMEIFYDERIRALGYSGAVIEEMTAMLKEDRDPGAEYDPVANPDRIEWNNVASQVARWILRFRGYNKLQNENKRFFELETFLNLECSVPVIYSLYDEAGWDRSFEVEKRLNEVYEGLVNMDEPSRRLDRALNALRISNILEFCQAGDGKTRLEELLTEKFSRTLADSRKIDKIKTEFETGKPDRYLEYMKKLVLTFRMPGSWKAVDEAAAII